MSYSNHSESLRPTIVSLFFPRDCSTSVLLVFWSFISFPDSDSNVSEKIKSDYPELSTGFDCIAEKGTTLQMAKAFASSKGKIVTLLPVNDDGLKEYSHVDVEATLVCTFSPVFSHDNPS